ncbi:MAG: VPDSG-CTERM sorting domain-containing protein [Verrucomicrobia bacterium]|nr:VPDSG-CTERM sorting domain-containing protein [Verrucomicrobiota bacterium]
MALAVVASGAQVSFADVIPYPGVGTENSVLYSFTAPSTGPVTAYFVGSTAAYDNDLGLRVNGVDTGIYGLNDHTSFLGQSLSFGSVTAGDSLVFVLRVNTTGDTWYSDKTLNSDGFNHVYATPHTTTYAGIGVPPGTYVAFEDLPSGGDKNYHDENFVFTNVGTGVPDAGSSIALLSLGCAGLSLLRRRLA